MIDRNMTLGDDNEKKEKLRADVLQFLQRNEMAVVGTVSPEGEPDLAAVAYVFSDDFDLYFVTKKSSRKFRNIERNKNVGVVVGADVKHPATVQMQGRAEIITDPNHFIVTYLQRSMNLEDAKWGPLFKAKGTDYVFIKVKVAWLRWLNLDLTGYPQTYREEFQQIIP